MAYVYESDIVPRLQSLNLAAIATCDCSRVLCTEPGIASKRALFIHLKGEYKTDTWIAEFLFAIRSNTYKHTLVSASEIRQCVMCIQMGWVLSADVERAPPDLE